MGCVFLTDGSMKPREAEMLPSCRLEFDSRTPPQLGFSTREVGAAPATLC